MNQFLASINVVLKKKIHKYFNLCSFIYTLEQVSNRGTKHMVHLTPFKKLIFVDKVFQLYLVQRMPNMQISIGLRGAIMKSKNIPRVLVCNPI